MKIKFFKALTQIFCLMALVISINTMAQTNVINTLDSANTATTLDVNVEVNYMRHYLWRSLLFGNDDVCQPTVGITYKKWSLILGANINYIPKNVPKDIYTKPVAFDEQDLEILYSDKIGKLDFEIKADMYIYFYQKNSPSTTEFNVKASYPLYKNLAIFSENVIDINAYRGAYYNNTGLAWDYSKNSTDFSLVASAGMGNAAFNETYFGGSKAGVFYWGTKAEITRNFKNFYTKIMAEYNLYSNNTKEASETLNTSNFAITFGKDLSIVLNKKKKK